MYKVYIADDEPIILEGLKSIIDWKNLELSIVGEAINGELAFKELKDNPVDILITDICMPKVNGLELIQKIKKLYPSTKFIILSGYNDFKYVKTGITLGIENYLLKPINENELISTLQNTIDKIESEKELQNFTSETQEILKDNVLYRWVTNNIVSLELKERAELLNINTEEEYYMSCILKPYIKSNDFFSNKVNFKKIVNTVSDFVKEYVKGIDNCIYFNTPYNEIVLIFYNDNNNIINEKLKNHLNNIIWHISVTCNNIQPILSIGSVEETYVNLYKSFENAKNALEYRFFSPENNLLIWNDIKCKQQHKQLNINLDYEKLTHLIMSRDNDKINNYIDLTLKNIISYKDLSPSFFYKKIIELLIHIDKISNNLNINLSEIHEKKIYQRIYELGTIEDMKAFLIDYINSIIDKMNTSTTMSPIIVQIINNVHDSYSNSISLKELSTIYNINSTYLGQLFKKEVGETFSNYLNRYRIEKAKQLIFKTNMKAIDIAKRVGYSDPNYFYRTFKKYMGMSPMELKKYKN